MSFISSLLKINSHRPFPLPERSWKYYQEWDDTVFLHYKVPKEIVLNLLPRGLLLDTYLDEAWVSVVAFTVRNMRLKLLPPLPYLSDFHEINLRTYVVKGGVPGIYFITIEASKWGSVFMANNFAGLKYKKARIKKKYGEYSLSKSKEENCLNIKYCILSDLKEKSELDKWLTERYCAYEVINSKLYRFNIHHKPWPLKKMKLKKLAVEYPKALLKNLQPNLVHFATHQAVLLWGREITS
jgi:uncharacterized protein YqjF (DUF2071 family)